MPSVCALLSLSLVQLTLLQCLPHWTTVICATLGSPTSQSVRRNHEDGIVRACGGGVHCIALDPGIRGSGDGPGEGFCVLGRM